MSEMKKYDLSNPDDLSAKIINILYGKKAHDIKLLKVTNQTIIADYFVIATGNSNTQIKALADEVEYQTGLLGLKPKNVEGFREASWVLLDYSSVIVHIFNRETREFYNLERLWSDAEEINAKSLIEEEEKDEDNG